MYDRPLLLLRRNDPRAMDGAPAAGGREGRGGIHTVSGKKGTLPPPQAAHRSELRGGRANFPPPSFHAWYYA